MTVDKGKRPATPTSFRRQPAAQEDEKGTAVEGRSEGGKSHMAQAKVVAQNEALHL